MGKGRAAARLASLQGTPAGRLDVSLSVRGEEGASWPDSPKQRLQSFLLNAAGLHAAAQGVHLLSHRPAPGNHHHQILTSPNTFSPATRLLVLYLARVPKRTPSHQAPPPVFFLKPLSAVPQNTVELQGFSQTPLGFCPSHARERSQHLFFSHFKSNHHFLHAAASTCNSLGHLSTFNSSSDVTSKKKSLL